MLMRAAGLAVRTGARALRGHPASLSAAAGESFSFPLARAFVRLRLWEKEWLLQRRGLHDVGGKGGAPDVSSTPEQEKEEESCGRGSLEARTKTATT